MSIIPASSQYPSQPPPSSAPQINSLAKLWQISQSRKLSETISHVKCLLYLAPYLQFPQSSRILLQSPTTPPLPLQTPHTLQKINKNRQKLPNSFYIFIISQNLSHRSTRRAFPIQRSCKPRIRSKTISFSHPHTYHPIQSKKRWGGERTILLVESSIFNISKTAQKPKKNQKKTFNHPRTGGGNIYCFLVWNLDTVLYKSDQLLGVGCWALCG